MIAAQVIEPVYVGKYQQQTNQTNEIVVAENNTKNINNSHHNTIAISMCFILIVCLILILWKR